MSIDKKNENPIGVFDSGVGGISVLRELVKIMPNENYLYFGDSINAPYGTKEVSVIRELTIKNIEKLLDMGAKSIVVACNTATSAAVRVLRQMYPEIPLVGIEPAIKPAVEYKEKSRVVVMATPMTLKQEKFQNLMKKYENQAEIVPLPCPGLMEFVERGDLEGEDLYNYLSILFGSLNSKKIDSVVLGCTHYPFAKKAIEAVVGKDVQIFDGGEGTAREMRRRMQCASLINPSKEKGTVKFINSKDTEEERELCEFLLNLKM